VELDYFDPGKPFSSKPPNLLSLAVKSIHGFPAEASAAQMGIGVAVQLKRYSPPRLVQAVQAAR
jgi:hypothetical protein